MKKVIATIGFSCLLISCLYEKGGVVNPEVSNSTDTGEYSPDGTTTTPSESGLCDLFTSGYAGAVNSQGEICFDTQILPILVSNCTGSGCHDSRSKKDGYELVSYETITRKGISPGKPGSSKIYKVLLDSGEDRMPPAPRSPLSNSQIKLISDWISQGAKNTLCRTNDSSAVNLPDSIQISYLTHIKPIMEFYCTGCHSGGQASGNITLDSYISVSKQAKNGKLYGSVAALPGFVAMPVGSSLSSCQIAAIRKWTEQGALNN